MDFSNVKVRGRLDAPRLVPYHLTRQSKHTLDKGNMGANDLIRQNNVTRSGNNVASRTWKRVREIV